MTLEDRAQAEQFGDLAERCVKLAGKLACLVRDEGRQAVAKFLDKLTPEETRALLVVLAAMVPVDQPPADLLDWVTFDEFAHPLTRTRRKPRPRSPDTLKPCGTYAAYMRHKARHEPTDPACEDAAREYWLDRKHARRAPTSDQSQQRPPLRVVRAEGESNAA